MWRHPASCRASVLNVLVTGGSRGLGLAMAVKLAESGFNVIAVARKSSEALDAAIRRPVDHGALSFRAFDLAAIDEIPDFVKALRGEFGRFHGLVNNAGLGTGGLLANTKDDAIEKLIRLNVLSPIILTKHVVRSMMTGRDGRIVNLSSVVAATGYRGLAAYSATKASLCGFTRSLARELGPLGITVNAVAPGFVDTEMTEDMEPARLAQIVRRSALGRLAQIDDIADMVDFLFSEKARNITGTVMTVDAGNTA